MRVMDHLKGNSYIYVRGIMPTVDNFLVWLAGNSSFRICYIIQGYPGLNHMLTNLYEFKALVI